MTVEEIKKLFEKETSLIARVDNPEYMDWLEIRLAVGEANSNAVLGECWRNAREELPEERGYYLCYVKDANGEEVYRVNFLICQADGFARMKKFDGPVIAWIPLPAPPAFA